MSDFLKSIEPYLSQNINTVCFRGQSNKAWALTPKAYRREFSGENNQLIHLAESRLEQWEAEALPFIKNLYRVPQNKLEWLSLAQHYGLATTLLDWTSNPFIALFFSVITNLDVDGKIFVWTFQQTTLLKTFPSSQSLPANLESPKLFRPQILFDRLKVQQAMLAYYPSPNCRISPSEKIIEIEIPASSKKSLREQLYKIGVHEESIFGNLDSLANKINWISQSHVNNYSIR